MRSIKHFFIAIAIMNFVLWGAFSAIAGHGKGAMDGTGPIASIFDGIPTTISGTISALPLTTDPGLKVDTGDAIVTLFGVPVTALERMGFAPLTVGEDIVADCYEVTFSDGSTKLIAVSITAEGDTISLRDPESGRPVWRGAMGQGGTLGGNKGGQQLRDGSCLQ